MVLDCLLAVFDCTKMAATMRPDDMLESFIDLAVKEPDMMRLESQASVVALVNVQSVETVEAEIKRRTVNRN